MSLVADVCSFSFLEQQASGALSLVADVHSLSFLEQITLVANDRSLCFLSDRPLVRCHWLPMSVHFYFSSDRALVPLGVDVDLLLVLLATGLCC